MLGFIKNRMQNYTCALIITVYKFANVQKSQQEPWKIKQLYKNGETMDNF